VTIKRTVAIYSKKCGWLSVENAIASPLEASLMNRTKKKQIGSGARGTGRTSIMDAERGAVAVAAASAADAWGGRVRQRDADRPPRASGELAPYDSSHVVAPVVGQARDHLPLCIELEYCRRSGIEPVTFSAAFEYRFGMALTSRLGAWRSVFAHWKRRFAGLWQAASRGAIKFSSGPASLLRSLTKRLKAGTAVNGFSDGSQTTSRAGAFSCRTRL